MSHGCRRDMQAALNWPSLLRVGAAVLPSVGAPSSCRIPAQTIKMRTSIFLPPNLLSHPRKVQDMHQFRATRLHSCNNSRCMAWRCSWHSFVFSQAPHKRPSWALRYKQRVYRTPWGLINKLLKCSKQSTSSTAFDKRKDKAKRASQRLAQSSRAGGISAAFSEARSFLCPCSWSPSIERRRSTTPCPEEPEQ